MNENEPKKLKLWQRAVAVLSILGYAAIGAGDADREYIFLNKYFPWLSKSFFSSEKNLKREGKFILLLGEAHKNDDQQEMIQTELGRLRTLKVGEVIREIAPPLKHQYAFNLIQAGKLNIESIYSREARSSIKTLLKAAKMGMKVKMVDMNKAEMETKQFFIKLRRYFLEGKNWNCNEDTDDGKAKSEYYLARERDLVIAQQIDNIVGMDPEIQNFVVIIGNAHIGYENALDKILRKKGYQVKTITLVRAPGQKCDCMGSGRYITPQEFHACMDKIEAHMNGAMKPQSLKEKDTQRFAYLGKKKNYASLEAKRFVGRKSHCGCGR